jgi:hypothetical protein
VPLAATANGGLVVDLRDIRFAEPTLTLRLAASQQVHAARGMPFAIVPPHRPRVRDYLARAGLAVSMGMDPQPQGADVLMPVTRITRIDGVERKVARLAEAAESLPKGLAPASNALVLALSELAANACSHGESDHGAFVLAQQFGTSRLVLAVGDLGVGIPVHLRGALPGIGQSEQARLIAQALEPGVTGVKGEVRGNGLPKTVDTLREAGMAAAELGIWSGAGRVSVQMRATPGHRRRIANVGSYTPGTWVEVVLASNSALRA